MSDLLTVNTDGSKGTLDSTSISDAPRTFALSATNGIIAEGMPLYFSADGEVDRITEASQIEAFAGLAAEAAGPSDGGDISVHVPGTLTGAYWAGLTPGVIRYYFDDAGEPEVAILSDVSRGQLTRQVLKPVSDTTGVVLFGELEWAHVDTPKKLLLGGDNLAITAGDALYMSNNLSVNKITSDANVGKFVGFAAEDHDAAVIEDINVWVNGQITGIVFTGLTAGVQYFVKSSDGSLVIWSGLTAGAKTMLVLSPAVGTTSGVVSVGSVLDVPA